MNVGFIGLGRMGSGMAARILEGGHDPQLAACGRIRPSEDRRGDHPLFRLVMRARQHLNHGDAVRAHAEMDGTGGQ